VYHWESLEELLLESVDITSTSSAVWFLVSIETLPCPPTVMWISPDGCQANWFCCEVGSSETAPLVYFKERQQCHWHLKNLSPSLWREKDMQPWFHVLEQNTIKESNPELQDIKKNVPEVMKGLPKNYFQHRFQGLQGCWNACTVSKPQHNKYLENL